MALRSARRASAAGVLLSLLLLAGCAQRTALTPVQRAGLPPQVELADTPFHPQERHQCGPAALATVLNSRGVMVAPEDLVSRVYLPEREGSLQLELVAAAREAGLMAVTVEPTLDGLLAEIAAGHPVLVLQNLGLDALPRWHYAVAIGYDLEREELLLRSGTERRRVTPFAVFVKTGARAGYWGLVVLAPDTLPARADPGAWLTAAAGLEALGNWPAARDAYRVASERWPERLPAWIGLGNAALATGDAAAAEAALRRAVAMQPEAPAAWNNLAYALAARRCLGAAREAAGCARRLAPGSVEIRHSVGEMTRLALPESAACQALPACPRR